MKTKKIAIFVLILLTSSMLAPSVIGTVNLLSSDQDVNSDFTRDENTYTSSDVPANLNEFYKIFLSKFMSKIKINDIFSYLSVFQLVKGYVKYSDGSNIPNGVIVTITDLNNSNSMTVKTQQANKRAQRDA